LCHASLAFDCARWIDQDTYLVLDDFGWRGCSWRQTNAQSANRETLIRDLVEGQYGYPIRIVAFTTKGWSRDVTWTSLTNSVRRAPGRVLRREQ